MHHHSWASRQSRYLQFGTGQCEFRDVVILGQLSGEVDDGFAMNWVTSANLLPKPVCRAKIVRFAPCEQCRHFHGRAAWAVMGAKELKAILRGREAKKTTSATQN